jgi:hypothetical protein
MNVHHIQIPKKVGIAAIKTALAEADFGVLPAPEIEIVEYTNLFILDGIFSAEHRIVLTETLQKLNIAHF